MFKTARGYLVKVQNGGAEAPNIYKAASLDTDEEFSRDLFMELNWRREKEDAETDLRAFARRHGLIELDEKGKERVFVQPPGQKQKYSNMC